MPRKNLIAGNWKMNSTIPEAVVLAQEISNRMERDWLELVDVAVCPPFVDLKPVKSVFEFDRVDIAVGAQNVYWEPKGAFTGEISIAMIKNIGCAFCIVGHSEPPQSVRRDQRGSEFEGPRAHRGRHHPHHLRGRVAVRARRGTYLDFSHGPGARGLCRHGRGRRRPYRCGLRAGVGHRHGSHGHARAGRGGLCRHPRHRVGHVRR